MFACCSLAATARAAAPANPALELVLESPLARAQVVVHDLEVVAVLHHLAKGSVRLPAVGLPPSIVAELIDELAWYDFVHEAEEDSRPDLAAEQWSPHELWFHSRSRAGYHDLPMGATNWAAERHPALPARRLETSTADRTAEDRGGSQAGRRHRAPAAKARSSRRDGFDLGTC